MTDKNCEYCPKDIWDRKLIVDEEDQTVNIEYFDDKPFLEVEIAVIQAAPADFAWEYTKFPIDFCPKCGKKLI